MTSRTRALVAAAAIGGCALVALSSPRLIRRAPFFRLQHVEVVGTRFLDPNDVVRRLDLAQDASIIDPLDAVRAAALAVPGVVSATVARRLPGTLRVTVREAVPVALAVQPDRLVFLDHKATVLPFDPARHAVSLPIADRSRAATTLLARIMLTDPDWYDTIDTATDEAGDVVLATAGQRVRMRPSAGDDALRAVRLVRDYLVQRGVAWRELDARFAGRVFVRRVAT